MRCPVFLSGCVLVLAGAAGAQGQRAPLSLRFGVYTSDRPTTLYREFTPFLESLEKCVGQRLDRPTDIELQIFRTYEAAIEALVLGQVDLVRFGPSSYVLSKEQNPGVELLAMETNGGEKDRPAVIVVRADSKIKSLQDLRGKSFAFGDERSTLGRFFVQAILVRQGLREKDLGAIRYVGRHDKIVKAVELGDCDAGCVNVNNTTELVKAGTLRELARFQVPNKPVVARAGLPPEITNALRVALIECRDPGALKELKLTGFLPASDRDYDQVRADMRQAKEFASTQSRPALPVPPQPAPPRR
jgi:phosphonate transport system substrate-binding protein